MSETSADRAFVVSDDDELNQIEDVHRVGPEDFAQPNGDCDDYIDQLPECYECLKCTVSIVYEGLCPKCEAEEDSEIFA